MSTPYVAHVSKGHIFWRVNNWYVRLLNVKRNANMIYQETLGKDSAPARFECYFLPPWSFVVDWIRRVKEIKRAEPYLTAYGRMGSKAKTFPNNCISLDVTLSNVTRHLF